MKVTLQIRGKPRELEIEADQYVEGGTAVILNDAEDGELYGVASVWIPQTKDLEPGQFYLKEYSENAIFVPAMISQGIIEPVQGKQPVQSGFVSLPVYQFTAEYRKELIPCAS